MGFESLGIFRGVISELTDSLSGLSQPQTEGVSSRLSNKTRDILSAIDSDIGQAAQACTEVLSSRRCVRISEEGKADIDATFNNKARSEVEALIEALRLLGEISTDPNPRIDKDVDLDVSLKMEMGFLSLTSLLPLL